MQQIPVQQLEKNKVFQKTAFKLGEKQTLTPFVTQRPNNRKELKLIGDVAAYATEYESYAENTSALLFRLPYADTILKPQRNPELERQRQSLLNSRLVLIDPCTEVFRNADANAISQFKKLNHPNYLAEFFKQVSELREQDVGKRYGKFAILHKEFWADLKEAKADSRGSERSKLSNFVLWSNEQQKQKGAAAFLTPTPEVGLEYTSTLLETAFEVIEDAFELSRNQVIGTFNLDVRIFNKGNMMDKISNFIIENRQRCKVWAFKFANREEVLKDNFGQNAISNMRLFLQNMKSIKYENPDDPLLIGALNGQGFAYSLVGGGFDFCGDSFSNYEGYYARKTPTKTYRDGLNDKTLCLETYESLKELYIEENAVPAAYDPLHKFDDKNAFLKDEIDQAIWSESVRRSAMVMWDTYVKELKEAAHDRTETQFQTRLLETKYGFLIDALNEVVQS
jgi:hypothetical protein